VAVELPFSADELRLLRSLLPRFEDEWANTLDVPLGRYRLKVLSLDRILASKTAANRPKDRLVVSVLRDTLASLRVGEPKAETKPTPKQDNPDKL
jgi:hypothetical protein